jgi:hypothetical protein
MLLSNHAMHPKQTLLIDYLASVLGFDCCRQLDLKRTGDAFVTELVPH